MSMIALTEQLRAGRSTARTLLLLIALTGAVIVGLLAMHSLNTHTAAQAGHHSAVAADVHGATLEDAHASTGPAAAAVDETCADCGTGHSTMLAMACVLALLATVLLLARMRGAQRWLALLPRPGPPAAAPPVGTCLRPPSLTALCISRT